MKALWRDYVGPGLLTFAGVMAVATGGVLVLSWVVFLIGLIGVFD